MMPRNPVGKAAKTATDCIRGKRDRDNGLVLGEYGGPEILSDARLLEQLVVACRKEWEQQRQGGRKTGSRGAIADGVMKEI